MRKAERELLMENKDSNKTLIIVILAVAALCGCLITSCCAVTFFTVSMLDKNTISDIFSQHPQNLIPEESPESEDPSAQQPAADYPSDQDLEKEAESLGLTPEELEIIQVTEKTRGIQAEEKLAPVYRTEDELREYMIEELAEVTDEELADELGLYNLLGFAPKDFDLRQYYVDLYTEQIAGYYDPEENAMYLITDISPYENALTLSHEYTHYLQYNYPDFDETLNYDDDFCETNGETCLIISSLIEGDASLVENLVDVKDTILKDQETEPEDSEAASDIFDRSPKFFQDSLLFPYVYGFDFVTYHYLKNGFDGVNQLYTELPQSIEQVMHPEKYMEDAPIDVTLEPFRHLITKEFDTVREDVMNESDIMMLLGSGYDPDWQLTERQAASGADGWGGGSFLFARKDDKPLFFSKIVWDSADEAAEAEKAFRMYCDKRFGQQTADDSWTGTEDGSVYLIRQSDILYWMILPDNFESESLIDLIRNGSSL